MHKQLWYLICASIALVLTGCGGGGGGGGGGSSTPGSVTVSGQVNFNEWFPRLDRVFDYAGTTNAPVRGASVEVRRKSNNTVWSSVAIPAIAAHSR